MAMRNILVIGSANMDLVIAVDTLPRAGETVLGGQFQTFAGGKGANQAVAAARAGGRVAMLGCVGSDGFGATLRAGLDAEGIDTSALRTIEGPSGVALIATDKGGENLIAVAPGANGAVDRSVIETGHIDHHHIILAQLETPIDSIIHAAKLARSAGAMFILDPAPAQPLSGDLLGLIDWLTPNETEAAILLGLPENQPIDEGAALALQAAGAANVMLKLGSRGVIILEHGGAPVRVEAPKVVAIDTTAAGDAFNGAFAVGLTEGLAPVEAARLACCAASLSVTRKGAQASMARRAEIDGYHAAMRSDAPR
jgi:ribokinase